MINRFSRGRQRRRGRQAGDQGFRRGIRLHLERLEERTLLSIGGPLGTGFYLPVPEDLPKIAAEYAAFVDGGGRPADFVSAYDDYIALYEDKVRIEMCCSRSAILGMIGSGFEPVSVAHFGCGPFLLEGYLPLGQYSEIVSAADGAEIDPVYKKFRVSLPPSPTVPPEQSGGETPDEEGYLPGVPDRLREIYEEYQAFVAAGGAAEDYVSAYDTAYTFDGDRIKVTADGQGDLGAFIVTLLGNGFEMDDHLSYNNMNADGYLPLGQLEVIAAASSTGLIRPWPRYPFPPVEQDPPDIRDPPEVPEAPETPDPPEPPRLGQPQDLPNIAAEYAAFVDGGGRPADFVSAYDHYFAFYEDKIYVEILCSPSALVGVVGCGFEPLWVAGSGCGPFCGGGYLPLGQYSEIVSAADGAQIGPIPKVGVDDLPPSATLPPEQVPGGPSGDAGYLPGVDSELRELYEEYQAFVAAGGAPDNFVSVYDAAYVLDGDRIKVTAHGHGDLGAFIVTLLGNGFELDGHVAYNSNMIAYGYLPLGHLEIIAAASSTAEIHPHHTGALPPVAANPPEVADPPQVPDQPEIPDPPQPPDQPDQPEMPEPPGGWVYPDIPPICLPWEPVVRVPEEPVCGIVRGDGGSARDDLPEASEDRLRLSSNDLAQFLIYIEGLDGMGDDVDAWSQNGGDDTALVDAVYFTLYLNGPWQ